MAVAAVSDLTGAIEVVLWVATSEVGTDFTAKLTSTRRASGTRRGIP